MVFNAVHRHAFQPAQWPGKELSAAQLDLDGLEVIPVRHRRLLILSSILMAALVAAPASAQLFGEPPPRTIVLSPGWHLNGPPVRSEGGLHLAVRNDAGVMQDMTVLPNGAVTFAPHPGPAKTARPRKPKPAAASIKHVPSLDRPASPAPAAQGTPAGPENVTAAAAAAPEPVPAPRERPRPAATPQPAPTGPGFAHGVPINPLD